MYDPWGQPYRCDSSRVQYRVWSVGPDGLDATRDDRVCDGVAPQDRATVSHSEKQRPNAIPKRSPETGRVGNTLTVTKSGDDVVLSWGATGTTYDVVGSATAKFLNPYILSRQASTTYTYVDALSGAGNLEFFDVTDETETNRGEDGAGNLPPPPPIVDPFPGGTALVIGATASLTGTGFSDLAEDNVICFAGGICLSPDTATKSATQLDFTVPPGAVSSSLTVGNGILQSAAIATDIHLEFPGVDILRTLGFAARPGGGADIGGEYWSASRVGSDHVHRHYYDPASESWTRETREGPYTGIHYTSTKTDRFQNLYAGYGTIAGAGGSRRIATDPPANMANCVNLGGSGAIQVLGATPDPNPDGLGGRDVVYFAFKDAGAGTEYVKKVNVTAGGCSGIADNGYGNRGGVWDWDFQVGMSVDEATGDLYVPEKTKISVVATDETVSIFKTGFSRLFGVDVWHEPGGSFGAVLAADFSTGAVSAVPLDNPAAASAIAGGTSLRTVTWSRSSYSTAAWTSVLMTRVTLAHNTGGDIALRPTPLLKAEPYEETAHVWISAPDPDDKADYYQGVVRESDPAATDYSTFKVKAWWDDGVARDICAMLGDAPTTAAYEPQPTDDACSLPWEDPQTGAPNGSCDNQEPFDGSAGVGTSVDTNTFKECESGCGASWGDACEFEFRITQRYTGDNYRVYFFQPSGKSVIMSALVTAWKRAYVENDMMARRGGLLWEDPAREPDAQVGDGAILIAKDQVDGPPSGRMDNLALNDIIHIFDVATPFEDPAHDLTCVRSIDDVSFTDYVLIALGVVNGGTCTTDPYSLTRDYDGSVPNSAPPNQWDFALGQSGGVAVEGAGFFVADPSNLNKRDTTGPYDDAFTSFQIPSDGTGVVPYLPVEWFDAHVPLAGAAQPHARRFHQLWFQNKNPQAGTPYLNDPHNYFHLLGVSQRTNLFGGSYSDSDISFVFVLGAENRCGASVFPAPDLQTCIGNVVVTTSDHELAHQFSINLNWPCDGGHDPGGATHTSNDAWCSGSPGCVDPNLTNARCLMSGDTDDDPAGPQAPQTRDQINRMECEDLGIPQPPCTNDDCGLGIRNQTDPK